MDAELSECTSLFWPSSCRIAEYVQVFDGSKGLVTENVMRPFCLLYSCDPSEVFYRLLNRVGFGTDGLWK